MNSKRNSISRRQFITRSSLGVSAAASLPILSRCANPINKTEPPIEKDELSRSAPVGGNSPGHSSNSNSLAQRPLGKTGMEVSILAFGGGSLFMNNDDDTWPNMLQHAVDSGINYFDTAWNYGDGQSEVRFSQVLNNYRDSVYVATKIDAREGDDVKQQFYGSLDRLKMNYVDVLLMHAICVNDDVSVIENGVYKDLQNFKNEGTAKFIGFSVMQEADLPIARSLIENFEIDVVLGIINPVGRFGNCASLLPLVNEKNIGFLAMKTLRNMVTEYTTPRDLIPYALDKTGVAAAVIGHHGMDKLEENITIVKEYATDTSVRDNWGALEKRLEKYAETHTPVWTLPGYRDGMMV